MTSASCTSLQGGRPRFPPPPQLSLTLLWSPLLGRPGTGCLALLGPRAELADLGFGGKGDGERRRINQGQSSGAQQLVSTRSKQLSAASRD